MDIRQLQEPIINQDAPNFCKRLFEYSVDLGTSDIHVEPLPTTVRVRLRVDGILRQIIEYPRGFHPAVVSRLKIMANLKIDEQRIPQDGRVSVALDDGRELDLRMSTLPTVNGEKLVFRIVDKSKKIMELKDMGIEGENWRVLNEAIHQPNGIVLNSGPTGSGKTNTLYAVIKEVSDPSLNIMTIEDPVEIQLPGLSQSQTYADIGYTFAKGLRTALRQDPDIIMVGEIRDQETIEVAIQAALTGHLVLSTIHTNSAAETVTRMLNMGIKNFLITATLNAVIAQRLIRRLCPLCKVPYKPTEATLQQIAKPLEKLRPGELTSRVPAETLANIQFWRPPEGDNHCEKCGGTGYKGRLAIFEIMGMNSELKKMILAEKSALEIQETAVKEGMTTLEQDGLIKALQGHTSLEEVYQAAKHME